MISWAWLAGFLDGEGSLYYARRAGGKRHAHFVIYQKDRGILEEIARFLVAKGCRRVGLHAKPTSWGPMHYVTVQNRADLIRVLTSMVEFLNIKRVKAEEMLRMLNAEPSYSEVQRRKGLARWAKARRDKQTGRFLENGTAK